MKVVFIDFKFLEFLKINVEYLEFGVFIIVKDCEISVFCICVYVYYCSLYFYDVNMFFVF